MSHIAQKKLLPPSDWITLKPSGSLSTRTSHEYSSVAESWAAPVLRQLGHLRFSTQLLRAIHYNMRPTMSVPAPEVPKPGVGSCVSADTSFLYPKPSKGCAEIEISQRRLDFPATGELPRRPEQAARQFQLDAHSAVRSSLGRAYIECRPAFFMYRPI